MKSKKFIPIPREQRLTIIDCDLDSNKIYYVYAHITLDTNELFYIGKGKKNRAYSKSHRNKLWHNIVNKHNYRIVILAENMNEEWAFITECKYIEKYQPRANLSIGFLGCSGVKQSQEQIQNRVLACKKAWKDKPEMANKRKGKNNPFFGKKHSQETINKIKAKSLFKIRCTNLITNEVFIKNGTKECSLLTKLSTKTIRIRLQKTIKFPRSKWKFERIINE